MSAPARVIWNDGRRASSAVEACRDQRAERGDLGDQFAHLGRASRSSSEAISSIGCVMRSK
jgi:hypothetical protein